VAWNFRRSAKLGPLRLNFSKSGIGYSVGVRGLRIGKDAKGRTYSATSIPNTGIYRRDYFKKSNAPPPLPVQNLGSPPQGPPGRGAQQIGARSLILYGGGALVLYIVIRILF
jgi:hypothetical protein